RKAGDRERLRLVALHEQGFDCQETDPDRALATFTQARHLADKLAEPWWVLFYDVWRVIAMTSYQHDFRKVLDLAVSCALDTRKPHLRDHPWRLAVYNNLVGAYLGIDPLGYAEQIQETLDYLEKEIPAGPNDHRYVMMGDRREFLMATDRV